MTIKKKYLYLHSQKRTEFFIKKSGCGVIGSHARLRIWCREAWGSSPFIRTDAKIAQLVEHNLAKVGVAVRIRFSL